MLLCDRKQLEDEINRIYKEHYSLCHTKAVHDFYGAVIRRIRRYTFRDKPEIIKARLRRAPLDYSQWILAVLVNIAGKRYQLMIKLPKEIYDSKCTDVEVKR